MPKPPLRHAWTMSNRSAPGSPAPGWRCGVRGPVHRHRTTHLKSEARLAFRASRICQSPDPILACAVGFVSSGDRSSSGYSIIGARERDARVSDSLIVTDVEILDGKPCVRGTRLSVEFLLELAASGATQADILARYPQLTADGLAAAFRFAARRVSGERIWDLPVSA